MLSTILLLLFPTRIATPAERYYLEVMDSLKKKSKKKKILTKDSEANNLIKAVKKDEACDTHDCDNPDLGENASTPVTFVYNKDNLPTPPKTTPKSTSKSGKSDHDKFIDICKHVLKPVLAFIRSLIVAVIGLKKLAPA